MTDTINTTKTSDSNVYFLIHNFIGSRVSCWAHYNNTNKDVIIESIYGLADGMNIFPIDTFVIREGKITHQKIEKKIAKLQENVLGIWEQASVQTEEQDEPSLTKREIIDIYEQTLKIGHFNKKNLNVLFFINQEVTPWFYHEYLNPIIDNPTLRKSKSIQLKISNEYALKEFETFQPKTIVKLSVSPVYIRDNEIIFRIIDIAKERDYYIQWEGGKLSHLYYMMAERGVKIFT